MDTLLGSLLAGSHQVVLECLSESEYSTLTPIPEVMQPLFDDSRIRIEELPFLEHFFFLADEYWQQPEDDSPANRRQHPKTAQSDQQAGEGSAAFTDRHGPG